MNSANQFQHIVEYAFGHFMNPVIDIPCEVIEEPAQAPRLRMLPTVQMVRLSDADYKELADRAREAPSQGSVITLEMAECNLDVHIWRSILPSLGDGFFTPKGEVDAIEIVGYEAADADGDGVTTDFDPKRLQGMI